MTHLGCLKAEFNPEKPRPPPTVGQRSRPCACNNHIYYVHSTAYSVFVYNGHFQRPGCLGDSVIVGMYEARRTVFYLCTYANSGQAMVDSGHGRHGITDPLSTFPLQVQGHRHASSNQPQLVAGGSEAAGSRSTRQRSLLLSKGTRHSRDVAKMDLVCRWQCCRSVRCTPVVHHIGGFFSSFYFPFALLGSFVSFFFVRRRLSG